MRKNGLKWSNISVKKYHQSPTLGVRSGNVKLICIVRINAPIRIIKLT